MYFSLKHASFTLGVSSSFVPPVTPDEHGANEQAVKRPKSGTIAEQAACADSLLDVEGARLCAGEIFEKSAAHARPLAHAAGR